MNTHILFVDDDAHVLELESIRLRRLGYEVTTRSNGRDALRAIESDPGAYDLLLTDFKMPEIDGLKLSKTLRDRGHDLPIVLMSGYRSDVSEKDTRDAGITALLDKPAGSEELQAVLDPLLS